MLPENNTLTGDMWARALIASRKHRASRTQAVRARIQQIGATPSKISVSKTNPK